MIVSGHKTFDKQANKPNEYFGKGNVWANMQFGNFIRPAIQTQCNGFDFKVGELNQKDLSHFTFAPKSVLNFTKHYTQRKTAYLHQVRHWIKKPGGRKVKVVHGYILTDEKNDVVRVFAHSQFKSADVMKAVIPMITNQEVVQNEQLNFIS